MNEERVQEINDVLSAKFDGRLRGLFYTQKGLPRQKLYTKYQMLNILGITDEMNSFEYVGIRQKLGLSLSLIRKEARENKLPFIDFHTTQSGSNREVAYHGFMSDIDKMQSTIDLYNQRSDSSKFIAKITKDIMTGTITYLESGQQELLTD